MANVTVHGTLMLNTGEMVDLSTTLAEGAFGELKTSTTYSVTAVSLGQFANGKTITSVVAPISAPNGMAGAYIARRGEIACLLPVGVDGQIRMPGGAVGFTLQAGDILQVMPLTAASRVFTYAVKTSAGVSAIFQGTPSGSGDTDLQHILSSQSIGQALTGQTVVSHMATSVDGSKLSTQGVVILNDRGLPIGGTAAQNPQAQQPSMNSVGGYRVNLNFVARVTTNA